MSDAFGNVIDSVTYLNENPWPVEADSGGFFLELIDINSDNSVASNWKISADLSVGLKSTFIKPAVTIYPNPAKSKITVKSNRYQFDSFEIYDLGGRKMLGQNTIDSNQFFVKIENLSPGMYIIKLQLENGDYSVEKFSKSP